MATRTGFIAASVVAILACAEPVARPSAAPDIRGIVTADVAALLDAQGRFPNRVAPSVGERPVVTAATATQLALAYVRAYGSYSRERFERLHGTRIDFANVAADPYVGVAESPYGDIPDDANAPSARVAGPYYLVRVRANGVTFAIIAVSAFATDLAIVSGRIQTPETYGNEFRTRVVGKDGSNSVLTGEEAVARAYEAFGEPIAEPPRLIRAGREFFPQVASWRIRLAAPVRARLASSGEAITSDVIYIDHSGAFRVPSETQPQSSFRYVATDGQTKLAELPIREDLAVAFATITPR